MGVQEDPPSNASDTGGRAPTDPVERAAIQAARAARKALKAQKEAERARRLAEEYARIAAERGRTEAPGDEAAPDTDPVDADPLDAVPPAADPLAADPVDAVGIDAGEETPPDGRAAGRKLLIGVAVALVACLAFAVSALVVHLTSGSSAGGAAATRDEALLAARQDIVVLNTLDYRRVTSGLQRWSDASTGALHAQLARVSSDERKRIAAAQTVTTAKVLDAAVVNLDTAAGSATVIASVELTVHPAGKPAQLKRERLRAQLVRVGDTWKVSSLDQVGVTLS